MPWVITQNGGWSVQEWMTSLNSSVLNKMPRDYTAFLPGLSDFSQKSEPPRNGVGSERNVPLTDFVDEISWVQ